MAGEEEVSLTSKAGRFLAVALRFLISAIFIYAGVVKVFDPIGFANDIDNYHILPWPIGVRLAFYLPWLEIICGVALVASLARHGALLILSGLTLVFITASVIAKARGIDVSCGCFGHAARNLSFTWHLAIDFALLTALLILTAKSWPEPDR